MARGEAWLQRIATLAVGGTGLIYAWMRYAVEPAEPFAVVNHPLQPLLQHLHVLFAPLLVFAAGTIWRHHVSELWRSARQVRRTSGLGLVSSLAPMTVSGYLIQVAVDPTWRRLWVIVHLATSALWLLAMLAHHLAARSDRRRLTRPNLDQSAAAPGSRAPGRSGRWLDSPGRGF